MLVDDGSSTVSLPELPLLAVLPGTGGLTRVTDKRKVRRDHADVFCTTEEGVKGKRAVEWRLVDEVVPDSKFEETVAERAQGIRRQVRSAGRTPRASRSRRSSASIRPDGVEYSAVAVEFERAERHRHHHDARAGRRRRLRPPTPWSRRAPSSGRCGSRASSTTPFSTSALNEFDIAAIVFKSAGDPAPVLAYDQFLDANKDHWLAREIRHLLEARAQARRPHLALAGGP